MLSINDVVRYLLFAIVAVVVVVVLGGLLYFGVNYMDNSINNATQPTITQVSGNNRINANHKSAKNANNNNSNNQ